MRNNTRCTGQERISKNTVLAMLQAPSILGIQKGERVEYIDEHGRSALYRVASVGNTQVGLEIDGEVVLVDRAKVRTNNPPVFLDKLKRDDWRITSFDPKTRLVSIEINNGKFFHSITVTLPVIDYSSELPLP